MILRHICFLCVIYIGVELADIGGTQEKLSSVSGILA